MKAGPWQLIRAHYRTLVFFPTGERRRRDYLLFWGVPGIAFVACMAIGVALPGAASAGLLTTAGILSAFFFGVVLQVAERALDWADKAPTPGPDTTWQAEFLKEIAANAGYASLVSILTASVFAAAIVAQKSVSDTLFSSLGIALGIHLALLLSMVLARVFALIEDRLTDAETGHEANVTPFKPKVRSRGH
jgi:uncharacterized membrane protein YhaH (DUF805 family)